MNHRTDEENDGRFPDGLAVLTPFPLTDEEIAGPRSGWPWVAATVEHQCGHGRVGAGHHRRGGHHRRRRHPVLPGRVPRRIRDPERAVSGDPGRPWRGSCTMCEFIVHAATRAEATLLLRRHVDAEHVTADVWRVNGGE